MTISIPLDDFHIPDLERFFNPKPKSISKEEESKVSKQTKLIGWTPKGFDKKRIQRYHKHKSKPIDIDLEKFFNCKPHDPKDIVNLTPEEAEDYDSGCYKVNNIEFHRKNCIHQQEKERKEFEEMRKQYEEYNRSLFSLNNNFYYSEPGTIHYQTRANTST